MEFMVWVGIVVREWSYCEGWGLVLVLFLVYLLFRVYWVGLCWYLLAIVFG